MMSRCSCANCWFLEPYQQCPRGRWNLELGMYRLELLYIIYKIVGNLISCSNWAISCGQESSAGWDQHILDVSLWSTLKQHRCSNFLQPQGYIAQDEADMFRTGCCQTCFKNVTASSTWKEARRPNWEVSRVGILVAVDCCHVQVCDPLKRTVVPSVVCTQSWCQHFSLTYSPIRYGTVSTIEIGEGE